ncbi:MAG: signal peptidase II [Candidatus Dormibacteraeota bacterium]|nr:signal peptidase II [Candidatus Dormibacteraeota bacterium]
MGGRGRRCALPAGDRTLTPAANASRARYYVVIGITAAIVIGLDHLTKWLVVSHLPLHGEFGEGAIVSIDHVENKGAAFGLFPQFQWLYLIVAAVVIVYILLVGFRYGTGTFRQVLLGMILGGAISNGIDRLLQGQVVDFIDLHWWPVFNVADMCIVIGIILAVLTLGPRRPATTTAA